MSSKPRLATPDIENPALWLARTKGRAIITTSFSHDGMFLATGDDQGLLTIYETAGWAIVYECGSRFTLRCLVWHPYVHALVVGLQNGDVVRINMQTARLIRNENINIVRVHNLKGCINVLALDGQGRQLAVSYDEEISLYDVSKFDAEEMTHLHRLTYVKVEGVIPFVSGIHYVDADMLIVCFLDPRMGIVTYSTKDPYNFLWKFELRSDDILIGGSALSSSGRFLAVTNVLDGIDWIDVQEQRYLRSTHYPILGCYPVSIRFIAEGVVIAGDNSGRLVLATIEMAKNPKYIEYSAPYKGTRIQVLDAILYGQKRMIAAVFTRGSVEQDQAVRTSLSSNLIIASMKGGWGVCRQKVNGRRDFIKATTQEFITKPPRNIKAAEPMLIDLEEVRASRSRNLQDSKADHEESTLIDLSEMPLNPTPGRVTLPIHPSTAPTDFPTNGGRVNLTTSNESRVIQMLEKWKIAIAAFMLGIALGYLGGAHSAPVMANPSLVMMATVNFQGAAQAVVITDLVARSEGHMLTGDMKVPRCAKETEIVMAMKDIEEGTDSLHENAMRAPDDASCPGGDSNDEIYDGGDIEMRML